MADKSITQTIKDAEIDARSLSEFISKDASFTVTRRLAPTIHTLDYYLSVLNKVKDKGDLADIAISDTLDKLEQLEPTVIQRVEDAINNTAVEGGVLADTFVTVNDSINQRQVNMGFSNIAAIKAISGANIGMRVYSTPHASNFVFKATSTSPVNDGTVLQGIGGVWEMEDKDAYFASWFATPNVELDQSLKLQAGYDYATSKNKPFIIDELFWVDPTAQDANVANTAVRTAIVIRSNSNMRFTPKGHLKVIANGATNYNVLMMSNNIDNYEIYRPRITGDRLSHDYSSGGTHEWGHAMSVYESSNGIITKPVITNMAGDGMYVGKSSATTLETVPKNITIIEPHVNGVRRNGISLTAGDNVRIVRPVITKVGDSDGITGAFPKSCIDVEPEGFDTSPQSYLRDCIIESPHLSNSYAGFYIYGFKDNLEMNLHIKGLTVLDNISTTGAGFFHGGANGKGLVLVDEILYKTPTYLPMSVGWNKLSNLEVVINKVTHRHTNNFGIKSALNGAFEGKKLGNFTINNLLTTSYTLLELPSAEYVIDGYKIFAPELDARGVRTSGAAEFSGKDTFIDSKDGFIYKSFSTPSNKFPNIIWQDSAVTVSDVYIQTGNDTRKLKVGLWPESSAINGGVNIMGLSVRTDTGIKTRAHCKTLGGWIEFQNVAEGNTKVFNSYGEWTFD